MQKTIPYTTAVSVEQSFRYLPYIVLDIIFIGVIALVSYARGSLPVIDLGQLPFFALATLRLARTISFNEIAEWLRAPFCEVKKDSCGAGENVHPKGKGVQRVIGGLLSCPICSGTWAALCLFTAYVLVPPFGTSLMYVLAFAGGSEFLHWTAELMEWGGRMARVISGAIAPDEE